MILMYPKLKSILTRAQLFDFDYKEPTVYPAEDIEKVIYDHYKNKRMAYDAEADEENGDNENLTEWKDAFAARMNELMQSYAPAFDTLEMLLDPFKTVDITVDDETQQIAAKLSEILRESDSEHNSQAEHTHDSEHSSLNEKHSENDSTNVHSAQTEDERTRENSDSELSNDTATKSGSNSSSGSSSESGEGKDKLTSSDLESETASELVKGSSEDSRSLESTDEQTGSSSSENTAVTENGKESTMTNASAAYGNDNVNNTRQTRESDTPQGAITNVESLNYMNRYVGETTGDEKNNSSISTGNQHGEENGLSESSSLSSASDERLGEKNEHSEGASASESEKSNELNRSKEHVDEKEIENSKSGSHSESGSSSEASTAEGERTVEGHESEQGSSIHTEHTNGEGELSESATMSSIENGRENSSDSGTDHIASKEGSESSESTQGTGKSHRYGYEGVPADLLEAYRRTLVNYNLEIVNAFSDFFVQLYI